MRTWESGLTDFLGAHATRPPGLEPWEQTVGGWTNDQIIVKVLGAAATRAIAPVVFEPVAEKYDRPGLATFREAFHVCAEGYWKRDWRYFDLETLRACHPMFEALALPDRIQRKLEDQEWRALYRVRKAG